MRSVHERNLLSRKVTTEICGERGVRYKILVGCIIITVGTIIGRLNLFPISHPLWRHVYRKWVMAKLTHIFPNLYSNLFGRRNNLFSRLRSITSLALELNLE
jgi:hypothetical protein